MSSRVQRSIIGMTLVLLAKVLAPFVLLAGYYASIKMLGHLWPLLIVIQMAVSIAVVYFSLTGSNRD